MEYSKSEYEIQHFNFSVEQMKLEHRSLVRKYVNDYVSAFANSLIKKSNITTESADKIRKEVENISETIFDSFSGIHSEFDNLFEKYFRIPNNVLLFDDLHHEKPITPSDEAFYIDRLAELKETFKQNLYMMKALSVELQMFEQLQPHLDVENDLIQKIDEAFKVKMNINELERILKDFK